MKTVVLKFSELLSLSLDHPLHQRLMAIVSECYAIPEGELKNKYDLHEYRYGEIHLFVDDHATWRGSADFKNFQADQLLGFNMVCYAPVDYADNEKRLAVKIGPSGMSKAGRGKNKIAWDTYRELLSFYLFRKAFDAGVHGVDVLINASNLRFAEILKKLPHNYLRSHGQEEADRRLQLAAKMLYPARVAVSDFHFGQAMHTAWSPVGQKNDLAYPYLVQVDTFNLLAAFVFNFAPNSAADYFQALLESWDQQVRANPYLMSLPGGLAFSGSAYPSSRL